MDFLFYATIIAIISQVLFTLQIFCNYRYSIRKYEKKRTWFRPSTALIVPCRGIDDDFEKNIASLFSQDYENYILIFVVADKEDLAYNKLLQLKEQLAKQSKAKDVKLYVSGRSQSCSQKNHNLLYCIERLEGRIEIIAFADSDVCIRADWLSHLVYPLRKQTYGAATGYRWFVPLKKNFATLVLSALNAKVAQLLGNTMFNQAWGGSMAIRADTFKRLQLDKIWANSVSDDLTLTAAVKKAGLNLAYVPACLVASYQSCSWPSLLEFGRRQYIITRITAPGIWWFGLLGSFYSLAFSWGGLGLAFYAYANKLKYFELFASLPLAFFAGQVIRAGIRQKMIKKLLAKDWHNLKYAAVADILFCWLWSILMFVLIVSSSFSRTICWRGICYKLIGPNKTVVLAKPE